MARRRSSPDDLVATVARLFGRRRGGSWWVTALLVLIAVFAWYVGRDADLGRDDGRGGGPPPIDAGDDSRTYRVERVIDGDTFVLAGGERVRLIGVDTPETVKPNTPVQPMGPEASAFTHRLLEGRTVRLGFDKERRDRYGRMLAYVYLDDLLVNEELIRRGYGRAELKYPFANTMKKRFRDAEAEAKAARRGVWGLPADAAPAGGRSGRKAA